jgi:hypothetical protein
MCSVISIDVFVVLMVSQHRLSDQTTLPDLTRDDHLEDAVLKGEKLVYNFPIPMHISECH